MEKREYQNNKQKITDMCFGFFGMFGVIGILSIGFSFLLTILSQKAYLIIYGSILLLIYLVSGLYFYKIRKYISIGIIIQFFTALLIGLLYAIFIFKGM
jgi:hypothetical protein